MASEIFELSDRYIDKVAELSPCSATYLGIAGHDHLMTDFSPAGHDARRDLDAATLAALDRITPGGDDDRLAAGVLRESINAAMQAHSSGEHLRSIRIIAGDVESARSVFDLMPTATAADWEVIAERLSNVPGAFAGMRESWSLGLGRGIVTSRRQVLAQADQLEYWSGAGSDPAFFEQYVESAASVKGAPMEQLRTNARAASAAMAETAAFLRGTYLSSAREADGCGEEAHAAARREFLGAVIDPVEAYEWGWEETMRLDEEIRRCGELIAPGLSPAEVRHLLDTDPARMVHGEESLRAWLQQLMDDAMSFLVDGNHFQIDPRIRTVEAMISPPGGAAAMYYTGPSEDLSRPGRTWYPANGRSSFPRWGEPTTAYHEGVPGHHLQVAVATIERERLSRVQRMFFNSGHGEGWALYAERLMDEFGFLENNEYRLGYLYAQAFRAARVVVDIGIHCGYSIPSRSKWHPGEKWTPDLMLEFMSARSSSDEAFNRSEIDRYLGWPGQAISYKLGERVWLRLRDEAKARHGSSFDLAAWHDRALKLGNLGLDLLQQELSRA
ncbi:MAG: DUF885 domain-containing protein [Actinobacteria bacterium]|nr:DUF885 domain-containing protein [Actinomycetota bacterium]NBR66223.1 DUF885 domain-containing protein [Actinomycetota bacterium]